MPRPVHFEIHAENPERAIRFYGDCFGWKFTKVDVGAMPYWLIATGEGPGIDGGLVPRGGPGPADFTPVGAFPCTIDVPHIDEYIAKIGQAGGREALAKMAVPGVGWLAYFKDTEGNVFGIMQNDPAAR
jgi:predicted enzyme related to lactoylglutathione lyase